MKKNAVLKKMAFFLMCLAVFMAPLIVVSEARAGVWKKLRQARQERKTAKFYGDSNGSIVVDGRIRTYYLHVPSNLQRNKKYPLVIALHGTHGTGANHAKLSHLSEVADRERFIVVYPDGIHKEWADGSGGSQADKEGIDDFAFISKLIDSLAQKYPVDVRRVYATGMSNGGIFSHALGCRLSEKIAAIAPVAQELAENFSQTCQPSSPMPVMTFHGDADPLVPYQGGPTKKDAMILSAQKTAEFWAKTNGCGVEPIEENLPDKVKDGTTVSVRHYAGCRNSADVYLYTVHNGGHTWPGGHQYAPAAFIGKTTRDIDASELMWDFFKKHPKTT